jgi:polyhydroxybutyrate depolymerase
LVLVLHGAFSTGDEIEKWSGFSELAGREGFVVAYPNGIGLLGFLQHWNAGHCCGRAEADHVDDVGFLNYVIGDISDKLRIDPQRLYVVGHSNGGMLAYYYAAQASARVAGIGVVAGAMGSSNGPREPLREIEPAGPPVPLIAIHGREDEHVPFEGGSGRRSGKRRYVSAFESAASWARHCGCEPAANVGEDPGSGRRVVTWRDSQGHTWVALHALDGWRHEWPGTSFVGRLQQDHPLRTFEASQVIWEFFRSRTWSAD